MKACEKRKLGVGVSHANQQVTIGHIGLLTPILSEEERQPWPDMVYVYCVEDLAPQHSLNAASTDFRC